MSTVSQRPVVRTVILDVVGRFFVLFNRVVQCTTEHTGDCLVFAFSLAFGHPCILLHESGWVLACAATLLSVWHAEGDASPGKGGKAREKAVEHRSVRLRILGEGLPGKPHEVL